MGLTNVKLDVFNPKNETEKITETFLIDSGATYSFMPKSKLDKFGIKPKKSLDFVLADGTVLSRQVGEATFEYQGEKATSPVVFGEKGDASLLGAVTLETMGVILDPLKRKIVPMKMLAM